MGSTLRSRSLTCTACWTVAGNALGSRLHAGTSISRRVGTSVCVRGLVVLVSVVGLLLAVPAKPLSAQECELVARWDSSALRHAAAGAAGYGVARAVGLGEGEAFALGVSINVAKEVYDRCRSGFDVGDLAAGVLGTAAAFVLDRGLRHAFGNEEPLRATASSTRHGISVGVRFSF